MRKPESFDGIPDKKPVTELLDSIELPEDLRQLTPQQLPQLCDELRAFLLYSVGQTGGHLGANLGVVELTVALHYVFDTPRDRLIWDVGHQCYPHKILTGRRDRMDSMRQSRGLKGFPSRGESPYDTFGTGHSSTSISAALGMQIAHNLATKTDTEAPQTHFVAVIGDGAMTAGMAYEALCHAGSSEANLLVILNDNRMSISPNIGGLANYLGRFWASDLYSFLRQTSQITARPIPALKRLMRRFEAVVKSFFVSPSSLFESLDLSYTGPLDGHNVLSLVQALQTIKRQKGPRLMHLMTRKGAGLVEAEADPVGYHAITKIRPAASKEQPPQAGAAKPATLPKYQDVFGEWICERARDDAELIGITPAMCEGSGMTEFARDFPDRYCDVAIAEQHALTLAAGMACEGKKPVVAIYSTFLQRAYDQLIHDISIQNLNVLLAIDRAGLVGEDGPTHAGAYDLSFLRCVPELVLATPSDEAEMRLLLGLCYRHDGLAAVRYPRGATIAPLPSGKKPAAPTIGKALMRRSSSSPADCIAILAFGPLVEAALEAAEALDASVADMRFVKPLDTALVCRLAKTHKAVLTLEDNVLAGGAGSAVLECLQAENLSTVVSRLGIPDAHLEADTRSNMLAACGLDSAGIARTVQAMMRPEA